MELTQMLTLNVSLVIPGVRPAQVKKSAQVANLIQSIHIWKTIIALKLAQAPSAPSISCARAVTPQNS